MHRSKHHLFGHLVGVNRRFEPERASRIEADYQPEVGRKLDRQIA
jgi:hypothetical protein